MTDRLNIVPDPAFKPLQPALAAHLARIGEGICAADFAALVDPLMRQVLERGFAEAGAHEGTVWLPDESRENLVPALNTGPDAGRLKDFKQPMNAGLISMVFSSEQPFLENEVWKNSNQSKALDRLLQKQTCAMIAVPLCFLRGCRGVVSCVQLKLPGATERESPGFRPEQLACVERAATLLSMLLERRLLSQAVGWPLD